MTDGIGRRLRWRGALGALLGEILGLVVFLRSPIPAKGYALLGLIFILPYSLPIAALTGAIIGAIIWRIHVRTGRNIGIIARAVIGGFLAGILGTTIAFILAYRRYVSYNDIQRSIVGFPFSSLLIEYGAVVGVIAGIVTGGQPKYKSKSGTN